MNSNSSNTTTCDGLTTVEAVIIMEGVMAGLGAIACTVALVFAIVSRFYKNIVQRLILYKLIAMLIYSLSQFMSRRYDDSNIYKAMTVLIPHIVYCANLVFTFWLTIVLHLCIVHLKELKKLKKLEPIAIITSCLPLAIAVYIPFASFDACTQTLHITFTKGGENYDYVFIIGYSIAGALYFIISILVIVIFTATIKRSRLHLQRQNDGEAESLLATNNEWKTLSKQLLPLVVYPIVNTAVAMIFFSLSFVYYYTNDIPYGVYLYSLLASSGFITGIIVIIHLCILKCKKKQRKKRIKENERSQEAVLSYHSDAFTRETVASTNARTTYQYTHTSSVADDEMDTNI
uniref:G-protein coupled receptors family 1 profile domain-containing protein n=1 Tax=Amphimedon queenslandica TaxID=400682 RepID=A0A1X7SM94_AMPQE